MPVSALKSELIASILKMDNHNLLMEIKTLIEEEEQNDFPKSEIVELGETDWDELEEQLLDKKEEKYSFDEMKKIIISAR